MRELLAIQGNCPHPRQDKDHSTNVEEVRMKLPLRSPFARVLFILGLTLACANFLLLMLSESMRAEVGEVALLAFGVAGVFIVMFALFLSRVPRRGPT